MKKKYKIMKKLMFILVLVVSGFFFSCEKEEKVDCNEKYGKAIETASTLYKRGVISEQEYINRLKLAENQRIACEKNN